MYGIGKIVAPLISEAQAEIFGFPMIFYVFLVVSAALMFISIAMSKHFLPRAKDHAKQVKPEPTEEEEEKGDEISSSNDV
jgi:TRAP-type C4-dicarboxylate transport system permease small subunit